MKNFFIFMLMVFPLVAFSQAVKKDTLAVKKDTLVVRKDSLAAKKDTLMVGKDTLTVKKETPPAKRDSASVMKEAILLSKKTPPAIPEALVINESRFNISGGMGLNVIYIKDVINYLNYYIPYGTNKYKSFATAPDFYFNLEYRFWEEYGLKFEYGYSFNTYNLESTNEIIMQNLYAAYFIHSPSLLVNYIVRAPGYFIKFGAGLCFNIADFTRKTPADKEEEHYSANGMGIKLDAFGHTQFGSNFYMVFGLYLRTGFLGDLKNKDGEYLLPQEKVNMSFIYVGLSLGMAYYF